MGWFLLIFLPVGCLLMHLLIRWTERRDMRAAMMEADSMMRMDAARQKRRGED